MKRLVFAALMWAALLPIAAAAELFIGGGTALHSKCGGNGCFQQPPLPYTWTLKSGATVIGLRSGSWEVAYRQFGVARVYGRYVADADYDPVNESIRPGAASFEASAHAETDGVSIMYVPRWEWRRLQFGAGVGVLGYRQDIQIDATTPQGTHVTNRQTAVNATPIWTLQAGLRVTERASIGYELTQAWRLRGNVDSPVGGTGKKGPGLTAHMVVVRYTLQ